MAKETPGPWEIEFGGSLGYSITPNQGIRYQFEFEADAQKSAAAPEMFDVLERIMRWPRTNMPQTMRDEINAVLAKAKGEAA